MRNRTEVRRAIDDILIKHTDSFKWGHFGSNGHHPCYDPYFFSTTNEEEEAAYTLAAVLLEMRKGSKRHSELAQKVAAQLGNQWVTYPWIASATARILSGSTYNELLQNAELSQRVREGMKAKGLKTIKSVEEALL